jgi:DNA-binding XRE family transcriptional regulator
MKPGTRPTQEEFLARRSLLMADLALNRLTLAETIKRCRHCVGANQSDYAKMTGVPVRIISSIEQGKGNPTLSTLERLGKPFKLGLAFKSI